MTVVTARVELPNGLSRLAGSHAVRRIRSAALVIVGTAVLGVVAMSTNRRTREIGVRMALGATSGEVRLQIVWEQLSPVVVGFACGALVAAWATRFVTGYLYKTPTYAPWSWLVAIVALLVVALTGAIVPSRRASRVDPVQALRVEKPTPTWILPTRFELNDPGTSRRL